MRDEETDQGDKIRTPSGNIIQNMVQKTQTIFSPCEEREKAKGGNQRLKEVQKGQSSVNKLDGWLLHLSESNSKQTPNHVKEQRQRPLRAPDFDDQSGSESDTFATPPGTAN